MFVKDGCKGSLEADTIHVYYHFYFLFNWSGKCQGIIRNFED